MGSATGLMPVGGQLVDVGITPARVGEIIQKSQDDDRRRVGLKCIPCSHTVRGADGFRGIEEGTEFAAAILNGLAVRWSQLVARHMIENQDQLAPSGVRPCRAH